MRRAQPGVNGLFNGRWYLSLASARPEGIEVRGCRMFRPRPIDCELDGVRDMAFDLSMQILVVDDYNTMIRIIRNLLKQIGFENVDDASDGSAALPKMQGKKNGLG